MPYINGMLVQSGGSRPHVVHIMAVLANLFPNVIWKLGGRVDRTTWGGGFSAHSEGRAIDIYLDANDRLDLKLGNILFQLFHQHSASLKVDHAIWNGTIWSTATPAPEPYTGDGGPHRDHLHVAFTDDDLDQLPLAFSAFCTMAVWRYVQGGDGAADRMDGIYGKAFDPRHPNVRLSERQRHKIMLKKMGMEGSGL